ncbi:hypothetical protein [Kordiimonas aquimaris]|uniref:hypothetical protein n=1 Tax=Kordiimonas aquimaris TaxID=707591 RepID=UPI0021CF9554|nr:hypothetical protein [Kordiimonas aquimaris]
MKDTFKITEWLEAQVGRSKADVILDAEAKAAETKTAIIMAQRDRRVSLQTRAVVSMISKADSRIRYFLTFARSLDKRPIGVIAADWQRYHAIVAAWVERSDVPPETLALFGE